LITLEGLDVGHICQLQWRRDQLALSVGVRDAGLHDLETFKGPKGRLGNAVSWGNWRRVTHFTGNYGREER
jgi:hypothetical protein